VADWFVTSDGRKIPVYDRYRYDTKPGWQFFRPLHDLALVRTLGGLTDVERTAVDVAIGTRRVGLPLDEIEDLLTGVARRTPDSFLWSEGSPPLLKPTRGETERRIWRLVQRRERQLRAAGFRSGRNRPRVLEIGYTSGGHSLAAFERLGFEVTGIDNYYDGVVDRPTSPTSRSTTSPVPPPSSSSATSPPRVCWTVASSTWCSPRASWNTSATSRAPSASAVG